ncbi:tripartite tricarboxylate transporter substrate binding protein [Roseomonas sp. NAR14]|uniref:Tripartite tricarboxylate transporter substrate binding protein n=1 Tax=Roseomonas acroporae TaxID=2937791 RepID=A0A9X1YIF4_9PROT|nr:tripartite tricarboxylate transporter substrate binding protein [Roseomonas acroporae]MCK8786781.1 tripartite tricarboxylate transporter substrate binding protein [Roseomonas acroporae]
MPQHPTRRRNFLALGGAALATPLAAPALLRPALAQPAFPNRPVRLLVPYGAGGTTDVQMRALGEAAARRFGQPVVIENKPGAGGILAAQALLTERPDGHTLAQMPAPVFRYPVMAQRPPFDPMTDFTWVIQLTGYLFGVAVRPDAPWKTFGELLDDAKANPGKINYGTPGVATSLHITMEQIAGMRGIDWTHVPFRGVAENMTALLAGQIDVMADSSGWAQLVQDGQLRLLVTWGAERAKRFPEVPTLRESGVDLVSTSPFGLAGPKGLSPETVRVLHAALKEALFDPSHLAILDRYDMEVAYLGPEDYAAAARQQYETERATIRRLGLRL